MEAHVKPETFDAFLRGTCGAGQASQVEAHIDVCQDCRVLLSELARAAPGVPLATTDVAPNPLPLREGELIGAKYRVERILGSGGMGTVVAAWHLQLNQRVALKFMLPALAADPQAVARFQREARAAVRLQTRHAGRVLDLDALPDGTPFLVMELLEGETMEQRLRRDTRIAPALAVEWMEQALEALSEAHALGIVHRDLKPANLFLTKTAEGGVVVKVLDFGIAKSAHPDIEHGLAATTSSVMVGSPPYMAPEQLNPGAVIDARTDLWAAGVVLYQLLSGHLPFEGENLVGLMFAIQNRPHRPLSEVAPGLPAGLYRVVNHCLAKPQAERPQDAQSLLRSLKEALVTPPEPTPAPSTPTRVRSRARMAILGGGLGLALVGALAFAFWPSASPPPPPREVAIRPLPPPAPVSVPVPQKVAPPAPEPRVAASPPLAKHAKAPRPAPHAPSAKPAAATKADEDPFEERR